MKSKKVMGLVFAVAVLFLFGSVIPVAAYTVTIQNELGDGMYVSLYTRSDNSSDNLPKLFGQEQFIAPNGSYTFTVPWDSRHMCPSYVVGYRATDGKRLGPTCCDGMINCTLSRSCHDLRFKITVTRGGLVLKLLTIFVD